MKNKILAYTACFITGAATLIIELAAFRMLAPYFGNSSYVTGIIINTVLFALASGYYIGGYFADKYKNNVLPYILIFASGIYLFIIYLTFPFLLKSLSNLSVISGALISVFFMFFLPVTACAFIPTYFIKVLSKMDNVGKTAGRIYALSTLGSIFGGVCTTFVLIPMMGSSLTFLLSIIILFTIAITGLTLQSLKALFLILIFPLLIFVRTDLKSSLVYSAESQYNIIKVKDIDNELYLYMNNYYGYHSKTLDKNKLSNSYYDYFLLGPMIADKNDILILGNCAGTAMSELTYYFDANIDAVDIDPKLTETGRKFFSLKTDDKRKIIHQDARVYLNKIKKKYDVVIVDLYSGSAYVPFHLATLEFFKLVNNALREDGILIINMPFYALKTALEEYYVNTIQQVFGSNYKIENILFVFKKNIEKNEIIDKLNKFAGHPVLKDIIAGAKKDIKENKNYNSKLIFTDDKSQIEKVTFSIISR